MRLAIVNITAGRLSGGYSKYLENLIPYLLQNKEISALLVAIPEGVNFTAWRMKFPSVQWVTLKPRPWSLFSVRNSEKKMIGNFSPDIIFIPTARFCKLGNIAVINMVRNMEPLIRLKNSNNLFHRLKLAIQYQITKNAVFRADRVIAVSDFVKQFLISKWNIPNKKIGMIYYGCKIEEGADSVCQKPSILPKHLKNKGFIFAAGSICAYRGLEDIIEAMGHLKSKNGYLPELVIGINLRKILIKKV
jgi:glycosyltransferase involved in cell wall biosynthesis